MEVAGRLRKDYGLATGAAPEGRPVVLLVLDALL